MPRCPECGKEIDRLVSYSRCIKEYEFSIDKLTDLSDYKHTDDISTHQDPEYACPECEKTLFTFEGDAEKFLRSKPEPEKKEKVIFT